MTIALERNLSTSRIMQRHDPTWHDYVALRDDIDWQKIAFHQRWLWADTEKEGPYHAAASDLLTMLFALWGFLNPDTQLQSYGRCLLQNPETHAANPDLVLYKGASILREQSEESRWIDFSRDRLPDLVGEIADTSLSLDLDEQKHLYASLGIAEYWVVDVKGRRLFAFGLTASGDYAAIDHSTVLAGLSIDLVEQTLERLAEETNTAAANWLMQQLSTPSQD
jgi:Uma2 family endonuclease